MQRRQFAGLIPVLVAALLGGCVSATPPSDFYILSSLYSSPEGEVFIPDPDGVELGLGPITLPDHLDRPQIVTRDGPNRLAIDEFHRWGGDLKSDVVRVMAQNLSYLLNTDRVHIYPWPSRAPVAYQLQFDVVRMDGVVGQEALLRARWRILEGEDGPELAARFSSHRVAVDGPGYAGLVGAESRALQAVAREMAAEVERLRKSRR